jgi:hypothetical protein
MELRIDCYGENGPSCAIITPAQDIHRFPVNQLLMSTSMVISCWSRAGGGTYPGCELKGQHLEIEITGQARRPFFEESGPC